MPASARAPIRAARGDFVAVSIHNILASMGPQPQHTLSSIAINHAPEVYRAAAGLSNGHLYPLPCAYRQADSHTCPLPCAPYWMGGRKLTTSSTCPSVLGQGAGGALSAPPLAPLDHPCLREPRLELHEPTFGGLLHRPAAHVIHTAPPPARRVAPCSSDRPHSGWDGVRPGLARLSNPHASARRRIHESP